MAASPNIPTHVKGVQLTAVPRRRFPEFRRTEEWKPSVLGNGGRFLRGLTYTSTDVGNDGLLVLRSTNIQDGNLVLDRDLVFVDKECPPELLLQPGDLAICMSNGSKALVGKSAEFTGNYSGQVTVGAFCSIFRPSVSFAKLVFQTDRYADYIAYAIGGGNINNLKNSDLEAFEFSIPQSEAEQQKIADCLTSLDELIDAQRGKVRGLKDHRRGLMQHLFPRQGESRPRVRFPEFSDWPDWEEKAAGRLFSSRKDEGLEGLPIYSVTVNDGMIPRASFDRDFYDIEDPSGNKKALKGDLVYNMMRMWQGAQGVAPEDCLVSPAYVVLAPAADVCPAFFAFFFKLPQSLCLLTAHSRGLTKDRLRLYFDDFARMQLRIPQFAEQERIAECLTALDARITAEAEKLDVVRNHRYGLIQQLFPSSLEDNE